MAANKPKLKLERLSTVASITVKNAADDGDRADVDISKIYVVKNPRQTFEGMDELAKSIKEEGVLQPIVIHEEADGRFRLIAGERRLRASVMVGLHQIPATIKRGLTEVRIRKIQVSENKDREDLTPFDEATSVADCVEEFGLEAACDIWEHSKSWVSKRAAIRKYPEQLTNLLKKKVTSDFEIVSCLAQIHAKDVEAFERECKKVVDGYATRNSLRDTLVQLKARAKAAPAKASKSDPGSGGKEPSPPTLDGQSDKERIDSSDKVPSGDRGDTTGALAQESSGDVSTQSVLLHEQALSLGRHLDSAIAGFRDSDREGQAPDLTEFTLYRLIGLSVLPLLQKVERNRAEALLRKLLDDLNTGSVDALLAQLLHAEDLPSGWSL